ncbi:MAG: glutathione S-transferase family protein [Rhodobacteraceae bacterium]|nr:glutathione S-transferase family protein [Paracoccaceae bacterium]
MTGSYRLYGRRGSGSACIEAALAECGVPFEFVEVPRAPESEGMRALVALNPRGQVPVLILPDGSAVTESTAILFHIADAHPESRLAPEPGSFARAHHDRWLLFLQANNYEAALRYFYPDRYTTAPGGADGVKDAARDYILRHFGLVESAMADGSYPVGPELTLADIYLWMLFNWHPADFFGERFPRISALAARVAARPAIAPIHRLNNG